MFFIRNTLHICTLGIRFRCVRVCAVGKWRVVHPASVIVPVLNEPRTDNVANIQHKTVYSVSSIPIKIKLKFSSYAAKVDSTLRRRRRLHIPTADNRRCCISKPQQQQPWLASTTTTSNHRVSHFQSTLSWSLS